MSSGLPQHTKLATIQEYTTALDTLCGLARRNLYFFEKNYDGIGFNAEARYETLRQFFLANPANRLYILAHDTNFLSTRCPRMMMLLRNFGHAMSIYQTPRTLHRITEPFAVADESHYVRRFHFDDTRGILAQNDPENARALNSRFMEMWSASSPGVSTTKLGL